MNRLILMEEANPLLQAKLDLIELRLRTELGGRVRDLTLVLHNHGLVLCGYARTYYAKQLAQHAVMREIDLPILANEIEVS